MYRIVGADDKEYGPIPADQVRQWLKEGRLNGRSRVKAEGSTEWRTLADFPELMPPPEPGVAPATPVPAMPGATSFPSAAQQVNGPATGLIVLGIIQAAFTVLGLIFNLAFGSMMMTGNVSNTQALRMFQGGIGVATSLLGLLIGALIILGGMKMRKLESYGLAMTASIICMLPCSACCIVGIPIGIWSLVALSKPEVKSAFRS